MKLRKLSSLILGLVIVVSTITAPMQLVSASSQTPITRSQVEQRALAMINLTWTFNSANNTNISSQYAADVTLPAQFRGVTSAQATGIPYTWGGLDGLDSNSYMTSWSNFTDAISQGAYAGNVKTDVGLGYIPGTAGLDCSGFVQQAFNIKDYKQSTLTLLQNYFTQINLSDLKHMDILDKTDEHVAIFDKWGYNNGVYGAFTYEATPDQTYGGIQGTKHYFMSMAEINRGYIPTRYNYIIEDGTGSNTGTGTTTPPTTQSNLPYPVPAGVFAQIANVQQFANMRLNPSLSASIIGTVPVNTILYLSAYNSGWYQLTFAGHTGWVWGGLIAPIPSGKYVTPTSSVTNYLNIRSNPSTTASVIGAINPGQIATVIGYSSDGQWYQININGIIGWANKNYLSYLY